jgi:N-acetylneuraminic acid mutarotase
MALAIITLALSFSMMAGTLSLCAAEDSWVWKSAMHEGRSGLGVAVVNGKIYAIGGASKDGFCSFNEEYDQTTGTWTFKAPMPTSRSAFGTAVFQNKIYCIGGYYINKSNRGDATGVNEVYDPATDTWETKSSMPTPILNVRANVVDSKIYLIGGNTNGTLNQVYDPATDSWTTKALIPTAVSSYASAVVGKKIYVFSSKLNQIYDAENDSWSLGAPAPSPVVLAVAGATTGVFAPERIYVFGADADLPYWQLTTKKFTTQSYDPKTDSWTICSSMPTGRYDVGVAVVDDLLYVIGGFTIEFRTDRFTPNPLYTFSAVNQRYTPIGYGTVPPDILVVSPENKTYTTGNVSLEFTVNKPVVWLGYSLDGKDNVTNTGNTTIAGLSSGLHNVTVYAKDALENTGASETVTFTIAKPERSSTTLVAVASGASAVVIGAVLLVYFRRRKR